MQKKNLFLAICLLATALTQASPTRVTPESQFSWAAPEFSCAIPAPDNFQVASLDPSSVMLSWDFQPLATGGYRVRTYRASDHLLVSTVENTMDLVRATVSGLAAGEAYYSLINSRCEYGDNGENQASVSFILPILELIVVGYQGSQGPIECTLSSAGSCPLSGTRTSFLIGGVGSPKYFEMIVNSSNTAKYTCNLGTNVSSQPYYFTCGDTTPPTCTVQDLIFVRKGEDIIATFTVKELTGNAYLSSVNITDGYYIQKLGPGEFNSGRSQGKDLIPTLSAYVFPSPFSETLNLTIENATAENIQLQLYNLAGQKVLDQQFPGGQEQYSLSTASLSTGFYMLRIEADGVVQTLKVVKSE
jgi:hypothetical protein